MGQSWLHERFFETFYLQMSLYAMKTKVMKLLFFCSSNVPITQNINVPILILVRDMASPSSRWFFDIWFPSIEKDARTAWWTASWSFCKRKEKTVRLIRFETWHTEKSTVESKQQHQTKKRDSTIEYSDRNNRSNLWYLSTNIFLELNR